jgi:hypothetical protein
MNANEQRIIQNWDKINPDRQKLLRLVGISPEHGKKENIFED